MRPSPRPLASLGPTLSSLAVREWPSRLSGEAGEGHHFDLRYDQFHGIAVLARIWSAPGPKIGRILAFENAVDITGGEFPLASYVGTIGNESASRDMVAVRIDRRQSIPRR